VSRHRSGYRDFRALYGSYNQQQYEVAASILVGLGGAGALQGYVHERGISSNWKGTAEVLREVTEVVNEVRLQASDDEQEA
jgi:hypothetical protein